VPQKTTADAGHPPAGKGEKVGQEPTSGRGDAAG